MTASSAVSVAPLTHPWPADAGYFRSGPLHAEPHVDYGACESCGRSVYVVAGGAERHTDTSDFPCPDGSGFATMLDVDSVNDQLAVLEDRHADELDSACAEAESVGRDNGFEDGKSEGLDEGISQGRKAMHAEIDTALSAAFDTVTIGPGATAADVELTLRAALAAAWNSCAP